VGAKTCSYRQWAEALVERVGSGALDAEVEYWAGVGKGAARRLPVEHEGGSNEERATEEVWTELDERLTEALISGVCRTWRAWPQEVVLAGLGEALCRWAGSRSVVVTMEGHGREEWAWPGGDVTRTVGWFTSLFPVEARGRGEGGTRADLVVAAKEALRGVPGGGVGYGMLRYLSEDESVRTRLEASGASAVMLNYLGRSEGVEGAGDESAAGGWRVEGAAGGAELSPDRRRGYELEASAKVSGGRLRLAWRYSRERQSRERMREVLRWWAAGLEATAEEWRRGETPEPSVADFPEATLDRNDLDELIGQLSD
jgi:non-ribosomal peptide synthase protein (TIGR01720 family)